MFLRLLIESFLRQKRRKALAGIAILLGTTAVTAMLALATTIGDRIHRELAVYGANIVVTPKAANLAVNIGGVDIQPSTGGNYLHESDLEKLKTIFWHNNITGVSPQFEQSLDFHFGDGSKQRGVKVVHYWFDHAFGDLRTGAPQLHPWWKLEGMWPYADPCYRSDGAPRPCDSRQHIAVGANFAARHHLSIGDQFEPFSDQIAEAIYRQYVVVGIVTTNDQSSDQVFSYWHEGLGGQISRIDIAAKTRPEDAFARKDPDTLSPKQRDLWYCRPYANSIAYQIREAIPGADAQQVRRVEQSEGTVLSRISGLMWLVSAAALLAAGFAVSAAMATAVLERRGEIGLMRSLGAARGTIAALFYTESAILAAAAGLLGYLAGSALAWALGRHIFPADGAPPLFNPVLLPVMVALAVLVAVAGSTPAIRSGLRAEVSGVLRGNA